MILYVEGGNHLRAPIGQFIRRATGPIDLKIRPCGSGDDVIDEGSKDENALLLIDSEGEDVSRLAQRVESQIGPTNRACFMVQLMEAWFLADSQTLTTYYGRGFSVGNLPANPYIENISKRDVEHGLHNATRHSRKGAYHKSNHAPDLLIRLNPAAVYAACPNFARLINYLRTGSP